MKKKVFFIIIVFSFILAYLILSTSFFIPKVVADRNYQYGSSEYEKVVEYQFRVVELITNERELEVLDYKLNGKEGNKFINSYINIEVLETRQFDYDKYINHIYRTLEERFPINISPKPHKYEVLIYGTISTIDQKEKKILVKSIEDSPFYEHPFSCWVSIEDCTTIRNQEYIIKNMSDLSVDSKVEIYTKYLVLETDPLKASGDLIIIKNE